ncbi:hypothetical protein SRHO_G00115990 [Serrasalmus rhombeus]
MFSKLPHTVPAGRCGTSLPSSPAAGCWAAWISPALSTSTSSRYDSRRRETCGQQQLSPQVRAQLDGQGTGPKCQQQPFAEPVPCVTEGESKGARQ